MTTADAVTSFEETATDFTATGDTLTGATYGTTSTRDTLDGTTLWVEFSEVDLSDDTTTQWYYGPIASTTIGAVTWTEIENDTGCADGDFAAELGISALAASLMF